MNLWVAIPVAIGLLVAFVLIVEAFRAMLVLMSLGNARLDEYEELEMLDIQKMLTFLISAVGVLQKFFPNTTIDDKALDFLKALDASPFIKDWLQSLFAADIPAGAQNHIDPEDPQLIQAIEASPEMLRWGRRRLPPADVPGAPADADNFSLASALAIAKLLIQYWPMLKALYDAWKAGQQPTPTT